MHENSLAKNNISRRGGAGNKIPRSIFNKSSKFSKQGIVLMRITKGLAIGMKNRENRRGSEGKWRGTFGLKIADLLRVVMG